MKVIVDRFEGDFAIVEVHNREMINVPRILLPEGTKEGDIIDIRIDDEATIKRRVKIEELMRDVRK